MGEAMNESNGNRSEDMERPNEWETLKTLKGYFDDNGKAPAVQIRGRETDNGGWSFSYAFGIVYQDTNQFISFQFMSDKHSMMYMQLFIGAISLLKDAKIVASKNPHASAAGILRRRRGTLSTFE